MAIASLVLGIIGILMFWVPVIGPLVALIGLILAVVGISSANKSPGKPGLGMARAGLVLGILGLLGGGAFTVWIFAEVDDFDSYRFDDDYPGFEEINTDPSDGYCNRDRFWQDPDC